MELTNEFVIDRSVDETWAILNDLEFIAPCMPGAQLQEIEGDEYRGIVKIKVGPITAQYKGKASFIEQDEANKTAKLKAEGRDPRQGNANAIVIATMEPTGDSQTTVNIHTDLSLSGGSPASAAVPSRTCPRRSWASSPRTSARSSRPAPTRPATPGPTPPRVGAMRGRGGGRRRLRARVGRGGRDRRRAHDRRSRCRAGRSPRRVGRHVGQAPAPRRRRSGHHRRHPLLAAWPGLITP